MIARRRVSAYVNPTFGRTTHASVMSMLAAVPDGSAAVTSALVNAYPPTRLKLVLRRPSPIEYEMPPMSGRILISPIVVLCPLTGATMSPLNPLNPKDGPHPSRRGVLRMTGETLQCEPRSWSGVREYVRLTPSRNRPLRNEPAGSWAAAIGCSCIGATGRGSCSWNGVDDKSWACDTTGASTSSAAARAPSADRPARRSAEVRAARYLGYTIAASPTVKPAGSGCGHSL